MNSAQVHSPRANLKRQGSVMMIPKSDNGNSGDSTKRRVYPISKNPAFMRYRGVAGGHHSINYKRQPKPCEEGMGTR
jgi:hypothetical protein